VNVNELQSTAATAAEAAASTAGGTSSGAVAEESTPDTLSEPVQRYHYTISRKMLQSKSPSAVSGLLELMDGIDFKLIVRPAVSEGGFIKSKGKIIIKLKCVSTTAPGTMVRFRLFVSGKSPRGPVIHDFHTSAEAGLPTSDEI